MVSAEQFGAQQFGAVALGLVLGLILITVVVVLILRWSSRRGGGGGLFLSESISAAGIPSFEPAELIGQRGVAVTPLRPAGTAMFATRRLDVVTEATFIPQGATVEVTAVQGSRVIVRQVNP
jgi:membrane-bound serine protease (ClpP class)